MSIAFTAAQKHALAWAGNIDSALPVTLFFWARTTANNQEIVGSGNSGGSNSFRGITDSSWKYASGYAAPSYTQSKSSTTDGSGSRWDPVMITRDTAGSGNLRIRVGAASTTVFTDNWTSPSDVMSTHTQVTVGCSPNATPGVTGGFTGDVAEIAFWSNELGGTEWDLLRAGALPESVSSGSLIEAWSLLTASTLTGVNGRVLTAYGDTAVSTGASHPVTRTAPAGFTAGATLGAVVASGSLQSIMSGFTAAATLGAVVAGGSLGATPGVFVLGPIKVNGAAQAGAAIDWVRIYSDAGILLYERTGGTLDGSGSTTLTTSSAPPGTAVRIDWQLSGGRRRMPRVTMG